MSRNSPEDITAARTDSSRASIGFDCQLPDEVRTELVQPNRPRILGRPSNAPDRRRGLVLAVLVLVLATTFVLALWSWQRPSVAPNQL